jgi:hypothetical protein
LLHDGQYRIADELSLLPQLFPVKKFEFTSLEDLVASLLWDLWQSGEVIALAPHVTYYLELRLCFSKTFLKQ